MKLSRDAGHRETPGDQTCEPAEPSLTDGRNPANAGGVIESVIEMQGVENLPPHERREVSDAVEHALAEALQRAASASEWTVVAQLARELDARRAARVAPGVVDLEAERARREKKR